MRVFLRRPIARALVLLGVRGQMERQWEYKPSHHPEGHGRGLVPDRTVYRARRNGAELVKEKQHSVRASAKALSVLRSFVNNERRERRAALREQRERKPSEESREIAARRVFFGLRRAELARPAALVARPAALFGLRRQTNQAKEPGLGRLSTHLLAHAAWIGFASKWQQVHLLLYSSTLRSSFVRC